MVGMAAEASDAGDLQSVSVEIPCMAGGESELQRSSDSSVDVIPGMVFLKQGFGTWVD